MILTMMRGCLVFNECGYTRTYAYVDTLLYRGILQEGFPSVAHTPGTPPVLYSNND